MEKASKAWCGMGLIHFERGIGGANRIDERLGIRLYSEHRNNRPFGSSSIGRSFEGIHRESGGDYSR